MTTVALSDRTLTVDMSGNDHDGAVVAYEFGPTMLVVTDGGTFSLPVGSASLASIRIVGSPHNDYVDLSGLPGFRGSATILGGAGDDRLTGGPGMDSIDGGAGNDLIVGGGGADTLSGGEGDDTIRAGGGPSASPAVGASILAGAGNDSLAGGPGDDTIVAGSGRNTVSGGGGNDSIAGGDGNNVVACGPGDDTIRLGDGDNVVDAGGGDNAIRLGDGDNVVDAGGGKNVIRVGDGDARIAAGDGGNSITAGKGDVTIVAGAGDDTIATGAGRGSIAAGDGNNLVTAGDGGNTITAGSGDDTIATGSGRDSIAAGDGNNLISSGDNRDTILSGSGADTIDAGAGDDRVDAGDGNNLVFAGDGNDAVVAGSGADTILLGDGDDTANSGGGDDSVAGGPGNNSIDGGSGADILSAGGGVNTILGGLGNDLIVVGDGGNRIDGGDGDDTLIGGNGADTIEGGPGSDSLSGGGGNDLMSGGTALDRTGSDTLDGGAGDDTLYGGGGYNLILGGDGDDVLFGGSSADSISGADGNDSIVGGGGDDTLDGGDGNDTIVAGGGGGNARLYGGPGVDLLVAGGGADTLEGGGGADYLQAGPGINTFIVGDYFDTINGAMFPDVIRYVAPGDPATLTNDPDGGRALPRSVSTTPPPIPSGPTLAPADDTGVLGDNLTRVTTPRFVGNATAGTTVELLDESGRVVGTAVVGADYAYSVRFAEGLADGTHTIRVRGRDLAGNVSAPGPSLAFTIDSAPPGAPSAPTLTNDTGASDRDRLTSAGNPAFLVAGGEPGATVFLLRNGVVVGSAVAGPWGTASLVDANGGAPLADGLYLYAASQVDRAGNAGPIGGGTFVFIKRTPPPMPTGVLAPGSDTGASPSDGVTRITRAAQPTFLVRGVESGSTLELIRDGVVVATLAGVAPVDGVVAIIDPGTIPDGTYSYQFRATDLAGNVGAVGAPILVTYDTAAPAVPAAPTLDPRADSGPIGDGATSARVGVGFDASGVEAGAMVSLLRDGVVVATIVGAVPDAGGRVHLADPGPVPGGLHSYAIAVTDAAGNETTGPGTSILFRPDAPGRAVLDAGSDTGSSSTDGITRINGRLAFVLTGVAPGSTVRLFRTPEGGSPALAAILVDARPGPDGRVLIVDPATGLPDGIYAYAALQVDGDGVASAMGEASNVAIVTSAATPGLALAPASSPVVSPADGTIRSTSNLAFRLEGAGRGSMLALWQGAPGGSAARVGTADASGEGSDTLLAPAEALPDGIYAYFVTVTDAAGNVARSAEMTFVVRAPVPPPVVQDPVVVPPPVVQDPVVVPPPPVVVPPPVVESPPPPVVVPPPPSPPAPIQSPAPPAPPAVQVPAQPVLPAPFDHDGDGVSDPVLYRRPGPASWLVSGLTTVAAWWPGGKKDSVPVAGDFDGDGTADLAAYSPGTARWYVRFSSGRRPDLRASFGRAKLDIPVPGDYAGTGATTFAVFRPATGQFLVDGLPGSKVVVKPRAGDVPVPGDYDGDGKDDFAVYRPKTGQWFIAGPGGVVVLRLGGPSFVPVPAAYDPAPGGRVVRPAAFNPITGQYIVSGPSGNRVHQFAPGDIPAPGDYGGLGYAQPAVFRPGTRQWLVVGPGDATPRAFATSASAVSGDVPVAAPYAYLARGAVAPPGKPRPGGGPRIASPPGSIPAAPRAKGPREGSNGASRHPRVGQPGTLKVALPHRRRAIPVAKSG